MAKGCGVGKRVQSSLTMSSGSAGGPGTAYPSLNQRARSRSRHRLEQNGAKSSARGFLQIGQGRVVIAARVGLAVPLVQGRDCFASARRDPYDEQARQSTRT